MFVAVVFVEGKREHRTALRDALQFHARQISDKVPRCLRVDVSVDPLDSAAFLVYAVFEDEAAYKAYLESQHYSDVAILIEPWIASRRVLTYELVAQSPGPGPVQPTHPAGRA